MKHKMIKWKALYTSNNKPHYSLTPIIQGWLNETYPDCKKFLTMQPSAIFWDKPYDIIHIENYSILYIYADSVQAFNTRSLGHMIDMSDPQSFKKLKPIVTRRLNYLATNAWQFLWPN